MLFNPKTTSKIDMIDYCYTYLMTDELQNKFSYDFFLLEWQIETKTNEKCDNKPKV